MKTPIPINFNSDKFLAKYGLSPEQIYIVEGNLVSPIEEPDLADCVVTQDELISLLREQEYQAEGVTMQALIVALWEQVVENRPQSVQDLQTKRQNVKAKYPK